MRYGIILEEKKIECSRGFLSCIHVSALVISIYRRCYRNAKSPAYVRY